MIKLGDYGFVVIFNKYDNTRLRDVVRLTRPYNNRYFKKIYYKTHLKLYGDRFKYCKDKKALDSLLERVDNPLYIWR